jgi:hypothetical protein
VSAKKSAALSKMQQMLRPENWTDYVALLESCGDAFVIPSVGTFSILSNTN